MIRCSSSRVRQFNAAVRAGFDPQFGRDSFVKEISAPPFHAVRSQGTVLLTHGGVKISPRLRVERADGAEVPNLFAVGEVTGGAQVMGHTFASGQGAGAGLTFGILAGEWAARGE
jgi:fumarate reductase flavoprotein subunit